MITLFLFMLYLAATVLLIKVMLWTAKIWFKVTIGILEIALFVSFLSILL